MESCDLNKICKSIIKTSSNFYESYAKTLSLLEELKEQELIAKAFMDSHGKSKHSIGGFTVHAVKKEQKEISKLLTKPFVKYFSNKVIKITKG